MAARLRSSIATALGLASFAVLAVTANVGSTTQPVPVEIGEARVATSVREGAARNTETVRYHDGGLTLLSTRVVVDAHLIPTTGDLAGNVRDEKVWAIVTSVLPPDALRTIRQLNVVTDDQDATLAMVHRSSVDSSSWILSVDPAESTAVLKETIVHEYAHMLTLGTSQLSATTAHRAECPGVLIQIGCALPDSHLADWHGQFWVDTDEPADVNAARFVSDYAASSVHEDLAESFMTWVMNPDDATTPEIAARYAFFEARPTFVNASAAIKTSGARLPP